MVLCLGLTLLVLALLGPIVWSWYVTWGIVVLAPAAYGRLRTALIVISTFWAFAGMTSVHNIYLRMLHTFFVTDLLLVAMLLAVAIMPLGQFSAVSRLARPVRLSRGDDDGTQRGPRLGGGVLTGAGAGAGAGGSGTA